MNVLEPSGAGDARLACAPTACSAAEAIARVYSAQPFSTRPHTVLVISKNGEARWIIDPRALPAGHRVFSAWRPGSTQSRIAWLALRCAARLGHLKRMPGVSTMSAASRSLGDWLSDYPALRSCVPVILIGKPSITAKLTVFLCDHDHIRAVAKLPLTPQAALGIAQEATMLRSLQSSLPNLPRMLALNEDAGISFQSWCDGDPIARSLAPSHVDLLLRLPRSGANIHLDPILDTLLHRALGELPGRHGSSGCAVPEVTEHGDFVPWNMKRAKDGALLLLDWEYSASHGLPLLDLCHFFYRQQFLFAGAGPVYARMHAHPEVQRYCSTLQLAPRTVRALHLVYLLRAMQVEVPNASNGRSHRAFLREQLHQLNQISASAGTHAGVSHGSGTRIVQDRSR